MRAEALTETQRPTYRAVAVFDGKVWSALCRELGIASEGDTVAEAVAKLKSAVREALGVAEEGGLSAGQPVDDLALLEFLDTHQGREPMPGVEFQISSSPCGS
jgi:predicted RNase H-like HicB family nuclease